MAKYAYPAVFESAEEGGFLVKFPDFENVFTCSRVECGAQNAAGMGTEACC